MVELKGITWDHPRGYAPLEASIERYFNESGVRVSWHRRTLKDFGDTPIEVLADNYDLLVLDHPHMGNIHANGCLIDLNDFLSDEERKAFSIESVGPSFLSYNYHNHQYAIPIDAACQVAAFRPDLIASSKLPQTWEEVISLSNTLKSIAKFIGFALCPTDCNCTFLTLSAQLGHPALAANDELIPLDAGILVLQMMKSLLDCSHPDSINMNPIQLYNYMTSHDDIVYSPLAFAYINYANSSFDKPLSFNGIPGKKQAILGGAGIAISSKSKQINKAAEYVKWICAANYQKEFYLQEGGQPGQLSAWTEKSNDGLKNDFFYSILPTIENAFVRPRIAGWPQYQEWLGDVVHEYLTNNQNPEIVIEKLNQQYKMQFKN